MRGAAMNLLAPRAPRRTSRAPLVLRHGVLRLERAQALDQPRDPARQAARERRQQLRAELRERGRQLHGWCYTEAGLGAGAGAESWRVAVGRER